MSHSRLVLLLHSHLPFVRHPEHEDFLEENWLFEAVFETYLPLLKIFQSLAFEQAPVRLTMTLTPTLCAMLDDPLLRGRIERYLERGREVSRRMAERETGPERVGLCHWYHARFSEALFNYTNELQRDLVGAFAQLQEDGFLEIAASPATHGFLPMLRDVPGALAAQIHIGLHEYKRSFGKEPAGIWLPECAWVPEIEPELTGAGLRWFVVDTHALLLGEPRPRCGALLPCLTKGKIAAFGRDRETSRKVWSSREGYPGDPAYREFYRDLGQEMPEDWLREIYGDASIPRWTGLKMHRITGRGPEKEVYIRGWAEAAADAHAADFLATCQSQLRQSAGRLPAPSLLVSPFDTELFGHWWFEGPEFLSCFLRKAAYDQRDFTLSTPSDYLAGHPVLQQVAPASSSWGNRGFWEVWIHESNRWIYPHLHQCGAMMNRAVRQSLQASRMDENSERILQQMGRELLLAQSSDWAFLMRTGTAAEYARQRTESHVRNFLQLNDLLTTLESTAFLQECEQRNNLFPRLDWRSFAGKETGG